jgi:hypothetical protein
MQTLEEILGNETSYPVLVTVFLILFLIGIVVFVRAAIKNEEDLKNLNK